MTAQVGEKLIYEGEEMWMTSCPPLPLPHPRIAALSFEQIGKADGVPSIVFSTACWRQYVGTWELRGGRLYLSKVEGRYKIIGGEPIFAEWFSGALRVPRGEVLSYVHMGFESVYEEDFWLTIENGVLVKSWTVDNRGRVAGNIGKAAGGAGRWWRKIFGGKGS